MDIKISSGGGKSCLVNLSGFIARDFPIREIFSFKDIEGHPEKLRLDAVTFLVQEKMGFNLWWWSDEPQLICPLESRGYFDFEKAQSLHSPKGATGVALSSFKGPKEGEAEMSFRIILDFTKP